MLTERGATIAERFAREVMGCRDGEPSTTLSTDERARRISEVLWRDLDGSREPDGDIWSDALRMRDIVRDGLRIEDVPPHAIRWCSEEECWEIVAWFSNANYTEGDRVGRGARIWQAVCDARGELGIQRYRPVTPDAWVLGGPRRKVELRPGVGGPFPLCLELYDGLRLVGRGFGASQDEAFEMALKGAA